MMFNLTEKSKQKIVLTPKIEFPDRRLRFKGNRKYTTLKFKGAKKI